MADDGWEQPETTLTEEDAKFGDKPTTVAEASFLNKILREKLVDTSQPLDVQRANPNSPLFSVKSFEELHLRKELLDGIWAMGFNRPSKIQETALPMLLADPPQNMIAQSQSGTGKTAAFTLAMLSRINVEQHYPQALVLSPTLELAVQTADVTKRMAKFCPEISVRLAVRGERPDGNVQEHIVIGTPGTVIDWTIKRRVLDPKKLSVFVLDEADVMIAMQGHQDQSIRIHKLINDSCQVMLFSATFEQEVIDFAHRIVPQPITITLKKEEESLDNIRQVFAMCRSPEEKYEALSNIYGVISIGQAIVFCHTRSSAMWLANKMRSDGHAVAVLTGELEVPQRMSILTRFRDGKERLLITTNVCSRGIDIDQVTVVVNYDIPFDVINKKPDFQTYLHRIGRSGRFGKSGLAVNFVDGQRSLENLMEIEKHFGKPIEKLCTDNYDEVQALSW